ncbi:GrdX family protein [Brachyspira aalborgi]|uniref:GrdX protein n=1 Tax=Brachyspira aalborgi TaxID=29522 RepID=A0A5C8D533_9SPIR|nr:GrdX family protein [Brachyspira aalborgi]TXJ20607.1 GrdX protein [Brachyspira aalborgi]TXJ35964.1 GrdX protein [Brachyspira aalborgi]
MLNRKNTLIVTNNSKVFIKYKENYNIEFIDSESMYNVLIKTRDLLHSGYKLLTHPMSGSLKSNQTPYKSILLIKNNEANLDDILMIENAIDNYNKFLKNRALTNWTEAIKNDFKTVDLSLISSCFNKNIP